MIERLHPLVSRIVRNHGGWRDEPEDLMQDVYLRVFGKLDQFRGDMPLEHWVSRIALNACLDRLRRQKARPELRWSDLHESEQALLAETPEPGAEDETDLLAAREVVERLLQALPPADAWLLRELELKGRSLGEICQETGWNGGLARIRAFRARRRMKALFEKLEGRR